MLQRWYFAPLFFTAILSVACQKGSGSTGPSPLPEPSSTIYYTAIGASDAIGFGSSADCIPYADCPNGRGYVQVATRELRGRGFSVTLNNLGLPTAVVSRTFQNLGNQYGRFVAGNFIDQEAPFVNSNTTLVTIFAGANDVNTVTTALGGGAGAADQAGYINNQIRAFGDDFSTLLKLISDRAPSARKVVLNLPNMAGMPFLAGASLQHRRAAQMLSVGMTRTVINPSTANGALIIDLMCDMRSYQASTYSGDGFHPGDTGYAWIAAEVVAAATTNYKAPQSSCSHMIVVGN
jgi:lysophospholipase L1-like esterase